MSQSTPQETGPQPNRRLKTAKEALHSTSLLRQQAKHLRNSAAKNGGPRAIGLSHIELEASEMKADCKRAQALAQVCRVLVSVNQLTRRDVQRLSAAINVAAKHDTKGDGYKVANMMASKINPITQAEVTILSDVASKNGHKGFIQSRQYKASMKQLMAGRGSNYVM